MVHVHVHGVAAHVLVPGRTGCHAAVPRSARARAPAAGPAAPIRGAEDVYRHAVARDFAGGHVDLAVAQRQQVAGAPPRGAAGRAGAAPLLQDRGLVR